MVRTSKSYCEINSFILSKMKEFIGLLASYIIPKSLGVYFLITIRRTQAMGAEGAPCSETLTIVHVSAIVTACTVVPVLTAKGHYT